MIICSCNVLSDQDVRSAVAAERTRSSNQVYGCLPCAPVIQAAGVVANWRRRRGRRAAIRRAITEGAKTRGILNANDRSFAGSDHALQKLF